MITTRKRTNGVFGIYLNEYVGQLDKNIALKIRNAALKNLDKGKSLNINLNLADYITDDAYNVLKQLKDIAVLTGSIVNINYYGEDIPVVDKTKELELL